MRATCFLTRGGLTVTLISGKFFERYGRYGTMSRKRESDDDDDDSLVIGGVYCVVDESSVYNGLMGVLREKRDLEISVDGR